VKVTVKRE